MVRYFTVFHFYNTCLNLFNISSLFSGGTINSSIFLEFSLITYFGFTILSVIFPINSPVTSAALWTMFLEAVFGAPNPISNNCFLNLLQKFFANHKNPYPLTYFLVLGSIEYCVISIY